MQRKGKKIVALLDCNNIQPTSFLRAVRGVTLRKGVASEMTKMDCLSSDFLGKTNR